jgi:hypothetical protein
MSLQPGTNVLRRAPAFTAHRVEVAAADAVVPTTRTSGVDSKGFRYALLNVTLVGTIPTTQLEVYFWNERQGTFVREVSQAMTASFDQSKSWYVEALGRWFWVKVNAISGAGAKVSIDGAGYESYWELPRY